MEWDKKIFGFSCLKCIDPINFCKENCANAMWLVHTHPVFPDTHRPLTFNESSGEVSNNNIFWDLDISILVRIKKCFPSHFTFDTLMRLLFPSSAFFSRKKNVETEISYRRFVIHAVTIILLVVTFTTTLRRSTFSFCHLDKWCDISKHQSNFYYHLVKHMGGESNSQRNQSVHGVFYIWEFVWGVTWILSCLLSMYALERKMGESFFSASYYVNPYVAFFTLSDYLPWQLFSFFILIVPHHHFATPLSPTFLRT